MLHIAHYIICDYYPMLVSFISWMLMLAVTCYGYVANIEKTHLKLMFDLLFTGHKC